MECKKHALCTHQALGIELNIPCVHALIVGCIDIRQFHIKL